MSLACLDCKQNCIPMGTNVIGTEIQKYNDKTGWRGISEPFDKHCIAHEALKRIPEDDSEYRLYAAFEH